MDESDVFEIVPAAKIQRRDVVRTSRRTGWERVRSVARHRDGSVSFSVFRNSGALGTTHLDGTTPVERSKGGK